MAFEKKRQPCQQSEQSNVHIIVSLNNIIVILIIIFTDKLQQHPFILFNITRHQVHLPQLVKIQTCQLCQHNVVNCEVPAKFKMVF